MRVGFVGWRGMVGSVLIQRMKDEGDFDGLECTFYSTSNVGGQVPPERSCHRSTPAASTRTGYTQPNISGGVAGP